ncbi:hypothetical protein [Oricola cellulosilytica]|uniref:Uncharacterized protein n=1 Tax=Oricola cellulosilytica TaxID=1429082 RepID=A0A4R0PEP8_9HYPH|nr:hypothetical protein [Oricola cellulosilytica]TCD15029.1 hypothetical protein E0D97_05630 [Oricola cellulosilytica]
MAAKRRTVSRSTDLGSLAMNTSFVIWMRMPILYSEMWRWKPGARSRESERAVSEKMSAAVETAGKLQAEWFGLWSRLGLQAISGSLMPAASFIPAMEAIVQSGLEPYSRRVSGNIKRLERRRRS